MQTSYNCPSFHPWCPYNTRNSKDKSFILRFAAISPMFLKVARWTHCDVVQTNAIIGPPNNLLKSCNEASWQLPSMYSIAVLTFCKLQRLYTVLAPILQYIYTGSHISIGRSYHLLLPTAIIIRLFRSSAAYSMHNGIKFNMKLNKKDAFRDLIISICNDLKS